MTRQGAVREARGHSVVSQRRPLVSHERERHWVAAIAAVAAIASAYATYEASQQQAKVLDYQRKVSKNQAQAARDAAAIAAENQQDEDRRVLAAQRAAIGEAGVSGELGSPLLTQIESQKAAELNARRIRYAGEVQSDNFEAEAVLRGFEAKSTRRSGYLQAGTTLITGLAGAASIYNKNQQRQQTKA